MAFQLALGCTSGAHRKCCPCCPGIAQVTISNLVAGPTPIGPSYYPDERYYNAVYQATCPTPLEVNSTGLVSSTSIRQYYKVTSLRDTLEIILLSEYDYHYTGGFPSGVIAENTTQYRQVVYTFSNCPNTSDVATLTTDRFSVFYSSTTYTPGGCTASGPTTNNYTFGSISQTETLRSFCPGGGQSDFYSLTASGDTADLFIYGPGTLIGNDYWKWLGNLRRANYATLWI